MSSTDPWATYQSPALHTKKSDYPLSEAIKFHRFFWSPSMLEFLTLLTGHRYCGSKCSCCEFMCVTAMPL